MPVRSLALALSAVLAAAAPAWAQSLEETALTLERSVAAFPVRREGPGVEVAGYQALSRATTYLTQ